ncbi:hypothetical protein Bca101_054193 [Brassica carinata]
MRPFESCPDRWRSSFFDGSGNKLGRIPAVPGPFKCGYGLTVLDGRKIVFVGGKYKVRRSNEVRGLKVRRPFEVRESAFTNAASANVYEFNPATNRWRKLADMNIPRHNFACAVVEGLLYVIRGYSADDVSILNAEVSEADPHRRKKVQLTQLMMIIFSGNESRFIDIYDPRTKTWEELDSGQTLSVYSYTVVRNKVYFMNMNMNTPEMGVFDPEKNSWSSVDVPQAHYKLGQWNNKVILFNHEAISGHLDKEDEVKLRDPPIVLSGFDATGVLINF